MALDKNALAALIYAKLRDAYPGFPFSDTDTSWLPIADAIVTHIGSNLPTTLNKVPLGSGLDGALNFDGSVVNLGLGGSLTHAGNIYTMTRDIWCSSLTVANTYTLRPSGFRIFCTGAALINGIIECNGGNGAPGSGGFGGLGGAGAINNSTSIYGGAGMCTGGNGGSGGSPGGAAQFSGMTWLQGTAAATASAGNGGTLQGGGGGTSNSGALPGGATGSPAPVAANAAGYHTLQMAIEGRDLVRNRLYTGSPGGGGANLGGGGGGCGGVVFLAAGSISGSGTIRALGGNGGNGHAASNGGGGGGGCGGIIVTATGSAYPLSVTISVAGGSSGSPTGTGGAGGSGGPGIHFQYSLA